MAGSGTPSQRRRVPEVAGSSGQREREPPTLPRGEGLSGLAGRAAAAGRGAPRGWAGPRPLAEAPHSGAGGGQRAATRLCASAVPLLAIQRAADAPPGGGGGVLARRRRGHRIEGTENLKKEERSSSRPTACFGPERGLRGALIVGGMKRIRDPRNGVPVAAKKFKVLGIGLGGKGRTEYPLASALENSHQDLLNRWAIGPPTAALVKFWQ